MDRIQTILSLINKNEKKKKNNSVECIFKKYLNKEENDKEKFKKILDPLTDTFKGDLKEVQKYEGKDKQSIWMKRSTANLVSFGNSFQLIADETFYKNHKRIISKYPDLQKDANIVVVESKKSRDNKIIEKLEENEKKIRNIVTDSTELLKNIKIKSMKIARIKPSTNYKKKKRK